jgi:hypothetical protein
MNFWFFIPCLPELPGLATITPQDTRREDEDTDRDPALERQVPDRKAETAFPETMEHRLPLPVPRDETRSGRRPPVTSMITPRRK